MFFGARFGSDFSGVRIHDDSAAADSARQIGALAYTLGSHIAFAPGRFAPQSGPGRHLLAHELAHVVQQSDRRTIRRVCGLAPLPPAPVPIGAGVPFRYVAAERCLQTHYAATHPAKPAISLSFNLDWLTIAGGTANEKAALRCLRGVTPGSTPNFTGKSGMAAGEPDIWDFANQTMYEITTSNGAAFRKTKLGLEIAQANAVTSGFDCGGLTFDRGTWAPSGPLKIDNDLYITVINDSGVLIYSVIKDATKELSVLLLAMLLAAMSKMKTGSGAAGATAGKAVPVYAVASLAAMAIMLGSGKAEAKAGPSDEEPLVTLFKSLEAQGIQVPPNVQTLIESDPALKKKITDAMSGKGSPSDAQQALMTATMKLIEQNPDQFSAEDLETLLTLQETAAGGGVNGAPESAEKLRRMLDAVKRGQKASSVTTGSGGQMQGHGSAPPGQQAETQSQPQMSEADAAKAISAISGPRRRVLDALVAPGKSGVSVAPVVGDLIAALPVDLTDAEASQLISTLSTTAPASAQEALASVRASVAGIRNSKGAKPGGLASDQAAILAAAAKTVPATVGNSTFTCPTPDEPKAAKTYGLQLLGRSPTGVAYAAMATVRLDSVGAAGTEGTILSHSDGISSDGRAVIVAGTLVGRRVQGTRAPANGKARPDGG